MRNRTQKSCGGFLLLIALLLSCVPAARAQENTEATYKAKCAGCHGADGRADTPAAKALGVRDFQSPDVQKETDAEFVDIITKGKNKMPKYADKLKEAEIKGLVGYVRELGKKK